MKLKQRKQKGVSAEALEFIKSEYLSLLDNYGFTVVSATRQASNTIKGITVSGKTLRKIFEGVHIHTKTVKSIILELGETVSIENGLICVAEKIESDEDCNNN